MANITEFLFNDEQAIRTALINDEAWFMGTDIASALGYEIPHKAIKDHVDSEDKKTINLQKLFKNQSSDPNWNGSSHVNKWEYTQGNPNAVFINESGLYALIFSSKLPQAKEFKRWVTSEVLPSLRKQGSYRIKDVPAEESKIAERSSLIDVLDCNNEKTARQQGNDAGAMLFDMLNNKSVTCAAVFEELKAFINNVTILRNLSPQLQRLFLYSFATSLRYEAMCCDARKEQLLKIESIFEELSTISKDKELNREYRQKASDRLFKRLVKTINEAEKEISELVLPYSLMKKGGAA